MTPVPDFLIKISSGPGTGRAVKVLAYWGHTGARGPPVVIKCVVMNPSVGPHSPGNTLGEDPTDLECS